MPYFTIEKTDWTDSFIGLAFTIGWLPQEKQFQLAITIGTITIAMGMALHNHIG